MRAFLISLVLLLGSACTTGLHRHGAGDMSGAAAASRGITSATQLNEWYNNTVADCGRPELPPPLCSGVMLRATENNPLFLPWDPSPGSVTSGGVSFSWLRRDNNFATLVFDYRNGFIFYPALLTPPGKNSAIQALCVFPMDANSAARPTLQGCGPIASYPEESKPCTDQNIATAAEWLAKFNSGTDRYNRQCGWSIRASERDQAVRFMAAIAARQGMDDAYWAVQNELRLATWASGTGAQLPIQSFFYIAHNGTALAKAQNDRLRYFQAYGQDIPIIRLTLPASKAGRAVFEFIPEDQLELNPGLVIDTAPMTLNGVHYRDANTPSNPPPGAHQTRLPSSGTPPYRFASSNADIAEVNPTTGKVISKHNGSATITVSDAAGRTASYPVVTSNVQTFYGTGCYNQFKYCTDLAASQGGRLPTLAEWNALRANYGGHPGLGSGDAWSTDSAGVNRCWVIQPDTGITRSAVCQFTLFPPYQEVAVGFGIRNG